MLSLSRTAFLCYKRLPLLAFLLFLHASSTHAHAYVNWGAHALPLEEKIIAGVRIVQSKPADLTTIKKLPSVVHIRFTGHVDPFASAITVKGPDGTIVSRGEPFLDPKDTHSFGIELSDGGRGKYLVSWQVISSDDGHITEGTFSFFVGEETGGLHGVSGQPLSEYSYNSGVFEGLTFSLELLGEGILLGTLVGLCLIWRPLLRHYSKEARGMGHICPALSMLFFTGSGLILLSIFLYLGLKTWELQTWSGKEVLPTFFLFLRTTAGTVALLRAGLALLCMTLAFSQRKNMCEKLTSSGIEWMLLFFILLLIFARTSISHATATAFHPHISTLIAFIHLTSKLLIVGLTIAMTWCFLPALGRMKNFGLLLLPLARFSRIAGVAIVIGGITGLYIVWILLKNPANLLTTEWGVRSFFLLAAASALFIMRFSHFFVVRGMIRRVEARTISDEEARTKLIRSLFSEMYIGVLLILSVGILIATATPSGKVGEGGWLFAGILIMMSLPLIILACILSALGKKLQTLGSS